MITTIALNLPVCDAFSTLQSDFHFIEPDKFGNPQLILSKDVRDTDFLLRLHLIERLVDGVVRSVRQGFDFDQTLTAMTPRNGYPLGKLLSDLMGAQREPIPPRYEISENAKAFAAMATELAGTFVSPPGQGSLEEDRLVKTVASRLRDLVSKDSFAENVAARKRQYVRRLRQSMQLFNRQVTMYPGLYALRLDFGYTPEAANQVTLEAVVKHRTKFFKALMLDPALGSPTGYWLKTEYVTEIGYRHHVVILFDGDKTRCDQALMQAIGSRWLSITDGKGAFTNHVDQLHHHKGWGVGALGHPDDSRLENLLVSLQLMLFRDLFLRLEHGRAFRPLQMSKLPMRAD